MKAVTHNFFSAGLMLFFASLFGPLGLATAGLAVLSTILTNAVIDEVGHSRTEDVLRRTWATHSVLTAPFWGAAVWALLLQVTAYLLGVTPPRLFVAFFASQGAVAGWSHLFLESLTEGGVFVFSFRRHAIAHFSYNNQLLSLGFCALGVALTFAAAMV